MSEQEWRDIHKGQEIEVSPGMQISFLADHPNLFIMQFSGVSPNPTNGDIMFAYNVKGVEKARMGTISAEKPTIFGRNDVKQQTLKEAKLIGVEQVSRKHVEFFVRGNKLFYKHIGSYPAQVMSDNQIIGKAPKSAAKPKGNAAQLDQGFIDGLINPVQKDDDLGRGR